MNSHYSTHSGVANAFWFTAPWFRKLHRGLLKLNHGVVLVFLVLIKLSNHQNAELPNYDLIMTRYDFCLQILWLNLHLLFIIISPPRGFYV